jgi:hypothetical protein
MDDDAARSASGNDNGTEAGPSMTELCDNVFRCELTFAS